MYTSQPKVLTCEKASLTASGKLSSQVLYFYDMNNKVIPSNIHVCNEHLYEKLKIEKGTVE